MLTFADNFRADKHTAVTHPTKVHSLFLIFERQTEADTTLQTECLLLCTLHQYVGEVWQACRA